MAAHPGVFEDVRGQGLMLGLKMKIASAGDFITAARAAGLIVLPAGDNVVRLLPPLTISEDEVREGVTADGPRGRLRWICEQGGCTMNAPLNHEAPAFSGSVRS